MTSMNESEAASRARTRAHGAAKEQQEVNSVLSSYSYAVSGGRARARALGAELRKRGVYNPVKLVRQVDAEAIEGAIRWWDEQRSRSRSVSPGVLFNAIADGGLPGYGVQAETCGSGPELLREWQAAAVTLRSALGKSTFEIWLAALHPHARSHEGWTLGAPPSQAGWIAPRYGHLLARTLGAPVAIVACENPNPGGQP